MACIWDNESGGQYGLDPGLINDTEEQELPAYSVMNGTNNSRYGSTQVTKGGSTSDKDSTTTKQRGHAQVYMQDFVPVQRNANASPYMSMLGKGSTPLADPSVTEQRALRQARTQALVRLAGNLGRMASSDADGVTGPISRDQSSNNYLTSMKTYHEALPKYNAAIAKQNASLNKAQADLLKAQMEAQKAYDLQDAKSHNMVNYGNTKTLNTEARDYENGNTSSSTKSHTSNTNNSTTTQNGWKNGAEQREVRRPMNGSGSGSSRSTAPFELMAQPIKLRSSENGNSITKADAYVTANSQTVRDILAKIEKLSKCDPNNPGTWNSIAGLPGDNDIASKMIKNAKYAQNVLQNYYKSEDEINGISTKRSYNPWTIPNGDLNNIWSKESGNILRFMGDFKDFFGNEYGQMNVTYADANNQKQTVPYTRWYGNLTKRTLPKTPDYGTKEYYAGLNN